MSLIKCEKCGKEVSDKTDKCIHCGTAIQRKVICKECNTEYLLSDKVCPNCGSKISALDSKVLLENVKSKKVRNILIIGVIILVIIIIVVSCSSDGLPVISKIDMQSVYDNVGCTSTYCEVASDGSYLEIDTNPYDIDDYYSSSATEYIEKANLELGFTEALYSKMGRTRALDGTLTDENDKVKASWTYHPDKGLRVTYEVK